MARIKQLQQLLSPRKLSVLLVILYFLLGIMIYADYGISTDEYAERRTSMVNYVYMMGWHMRSSESESVQNVLNNTPNLRTWHNPDRVYGVFLQTLTVAIEHAHGFEMTTRDIFLMRHIFTFLNYLLAGIFFFLILQRRFGNTFIPLIGVFFFILSPRFFGESFFNIKDILFYSWCVIASYFVLRWLEDEKKKAFLIPAAFTIAVATNTRILGISILLLAGGFVFIQGIWRKAKLTAPLVKWFLLCVLSFLFYVIITPFVWENPIRNSLYIFSHFLQFPVWDGTHFYLGEMITRNVPWHYIPVWMGVTIPTLYIIMFLVGIAVVGISGIKYFASKIRLAHCPENITCQKNIPTQSPHLYDLFFAAMFILTLLGFIVFRIHMYEGWRHAYSIYLPFLYIAVSGLAWTSLRFQYKQKWLRAGFSCIVAVSLLHSSIWILINHPYQYVYFNIIGRQFAERNFTLDYWNVSNSDLVRYALDYDNIAITNITFPWLTYYILTEDEKRRVIRSEGDSAEFYIQTSRVSYEERLRGPGDGFRKVASITVDGMTISSLWQRILPFTSEYDFDAWNNILLFGSSADTTVDYLKDGNSHTSWNTGRPQRASDNMKFRFRDHVNYNYIRLNPGRNDYPRDLAVYTSLDGVEWQFLPTEVVYNMHFIFETEPYVYLRLELKDYHDTYWWAVFDIYFGYAQWNG